MSKIKTLMHIAISASILFSSIVIAREFNVLSKETYAKSNISHFTQKSGLGEKLNFTKSGDAFGIEFSTQAQDLVLNPNSNMHIYHSIKLKFGAGLGTKKGNINNIYSKLGLNFNPTDKVSISHEINPIFKKNEQMKLSNRMSVIYSF